MSDPLNNTLPQWLYSAVDARGRAAQGFVRAASAPDAVAALARTRPDLSQVQLRTTGMTVGLETALIDQLGAGRSPRQMTHLARQLVQQQEAPPSLARQLLEVARGNALWLVAAAGALVWGVLADWPIWLLVLACLALLAPLLVFFWLYRFSQMFERGLHAHAVGDLAALDAAGARLTQAAHRYTYLRGGAYDLAVKRAWHTCRAEGVDAARRALAAHPFPHNDPMQQLLSTYTLPLAHGDLDGAADVLREAATRWPDEPVIQADLALMLARLGEAGEARRLMAALPPAQLPPAGVAYRAWIKGLAALQAPDKAFAIAALTEAGEHFLALGKKSSAAWPALAVCTSDLALALAWSGRIEEARQTLQPVLPMVKAHAEPARLILLKRALRGTA